MPPTASHLPSGLAATENAAHRLVGATSSPLSTSHTRTFGPAELASLSGLPGMTAMACRPFGFGPAISLPSRTSHTWTTRSAPALASFVPSGLKHRLRISSLWPRSTGPRVAASASSHRWMSLSESAHARYLPSGLYATTVTWSAWLFSSMSGSACGGRHTRAEVSHPAEMSSVLSGAHVSDGTRSVWLLSSATSLCESASHTRTIRSSPAVARNAPFGANAIAETAFLCGLSGWA